MTGLHLSSYTLSKFLVLGLLCAVQSVMLLGVFGGLVGWPEENFFWNHGWNYGSQRLLRLFLQWEWGFLYPLYLKIQTVQ